MKIVTDKQIAFGRRLGLELDGKSVSEALAMIHDAIDRDFLDQSKLGEATPKQVTIRCQVSARPLTGEPAHS